MPGYEEFVAGRDAARDAAETVDEIRDYQVNVLGNARDRLTDERNPLDKDGIIEIEADVNARMPDFVRTLMPSAPTPQVIAPANLSPAVPEF